MFYRRYKMTRDGEANPSPYNDNRFILDYVLGYPAAKQPLSDLQLQILSCGTTIIKTVGGRTGEQQSPNSNRLAE